MEFFFFCSLLLLSAIILNLLVKSCNSDRKLPPGPRKLPLIGNIHQLYGGLLHHVLRDLALKYGPIMHLQTGEVSMVVVTSPEVAREVYLTHDVTFSQRPFDIIAFKVISYNFTDLIFAPYGDHWRRLNKICVTELLSRKRVKAFRSIREEEVFNTITSLRSLEGKVVNFSKMLFSLTYSITSRASIGKKSQYHDEIIHLADEYIRLGGGHSIADMYPSISILQWLSGLRYKLERTHKQLDEILESILDEHKGRNKKENLAAEEGKEDIVDILLNIQKQFDSPSDITIKGVIYDILSAGSDTTSTTIEWAMSEIIKHPEVLKRAQEEARTVFGANGRVDESGLDKLKYLQAVIKETLRCHPSAPLLVPREAARECEIHGYRIPRKARVFVNAWAIARDPRYWTEPEKFYPDRFFDSEVDFKGNDFEYIPFGAGRRMCPGIYFGLANIELTLAALLFHFDWKLPNQMKGEELDMTEVLGSTSKRANHLAVIPILYSGSSLNDSFK